MEDQAIRMLVAKRLKELRIDGGYETASVFAERVGVDGPRLSRMENGKQAISTLVLRRAATVLDVPMDAFFSEPEPAPTLMRSGEADDDKIEAMIEWARALRSDLDMISDYERGLSA